MAPSTKRKKQSTEGWPVAFSPFKKPKKKKSEDSLEFLASSLEDSQESALELPSLPPGPVLEACNGSDIQLARGASARPNPAKGRGRYLIILPGMLSLKTQKKTIPAETEAGASPATQDSEVSTFEKQVESEGDTKKVESEDKTSDKRKPFTPRVTTLGKIEKIESDHPIMKVPFGDGRTLVFEGKKVGTSSKFMNIHCKASKGSVTCKDIFTSAIVFGEAKVVGGSVPTKNENEEEAPFRHYGGSVRTVDGVVTGAVKKKLLKKRGTARPKAHSNAQVPSASDITILDDDDDESDVEVNLGATPPPRAPRPKRRAASQKKIKILHDSDEEEDSEEESVTSQGTPPPRAPRPERRASSQRKVVDLDESDESDFEMEEEARPPPRASTSKRKAAASQKKPPPSDSEESDVDTDTATPPRKPPFKRKATTSQNKAPVAKKARKAKKETSGDDLSFASSGSEEVVIVVGTKDKDDEEEWAPGGDGVDLSTPTRRPRTSHARRSAKKAGKEIDLTEEQSEKESSDDEDKRAASKPRKSRSTHSMKKTGREFDLTVDDGDESEEDEEDDESEEESDYSE